jgi:hypothetical protein
MIGGPKSGVPSWHLVVLLLPRLDCISPLKKKKTGARNFHATNDTPQSSTSGVLVFITFSVDTIFKGGLYACAFGPNLVDAVPLLENSNMLI